MNECVNDISIDSIGQSNHFAADGVSGILQKGQIDVSRDDLIP